MKKIIYITSIALLLAGCTSNKKPSSSSVQQEEEIKTQSLWVVEPTYEWDQVIEINPSISYELTVQTDSFGEVTAPLMQEVRGYPLENTQYTYGAVVVEKNKQQGIFDENGNELYPISLNTVGSPYRSGIVCGTFDGKTAVGIGNTAKNTVAIFSSDFKDTTEASYDDFHYNTTTSQSDSFYAVQEGIFGIVVLTRNESGAGTGWKFEGIDPSKLKGNVIVPSVDANCVKTGTVMFSPDDALNYPVASGTYQKGSFADGYYVVRSGDFASLIEAKSTAAVARDYQDAKHYADGYAPVKRNGKWGFVDTSGKEVTDFLFDDVTPLLDGRSYVKANGKYGIVDVEGTLKSGTQINANTMFSAAEESIGTLTVNVSDLRLRSEASTSSELMATSMPGSVYEVYETAQDDKYTWYRVAENIWVANQGTWCKYHEK